MKNPKLTLRRFGPQPRSRKALRLGRAAALLSSVFHMRLPKVTARDLRRHDFPLSTQRMGVRFTERIRDTFRFRWLRKRSQ